MFQIHDRIGSGDMPRVGDPLQRPQALSLVVHERPGVIVQQDHDSRSLARDAVEPRTSQSPTGARARTNGHARDSLEGSSLQEGPRLEDARVVLGTLLPEEVAFDVGVAEDAVWVDALDECDEVVEARIALAQVLGPQRVRLRPVWLPGVPEHDLLEPREELPVGDVGSIRPADTRTTSVMCGAGDADGRTDGGAEAQGRETKTRRTWEGVGRTRIATARQTSRGSRGSVRRMKYDARATPRTCVKWGRRHGGGTGHSS